LLNEPDQIGVFMVREPRLADIETRNGAMHWLPFATLVQVSDENDPPAQEHCTVGIPFNVKPVGRALEAALLMPV
jgi:hypothetical protein